MKNYFDSMQFNNMIFNEGQCTWMCLPSGKGELESENQGRSRDTSFSQETVAKKIQYQSRIDCLPSLLKVQDARWLLTHFPFFFIFFQIKNRILENTKRFSWACYFFLKKEVERTVVNRGFTLKNKVPSFFILLLDPLRQHRVFGWLQPAVAATRIRNARQERAQKDKKRGDFVFQSKSGFSGIFWGGV